MKKTRLLGSLSGAALLAGAMTLAAAPAHADVVDVTLPSIPAETNPYSAGWFAGTVTGGDGTATQTALGLEISGGTNGYQLLNGDPAQGPAGTLAEVTDYVAVSSVGDAYYQISVFGEPGEADEQFTTLRPVDPAEPWGDWRTSRAFGAYAADDVDTRANFVAALDAGVPAQVLAFGVFVNAGDDVILRGIEWDGDQYLFADAPTITVTPDEVALDELPATVTIVASGFVPGELVSFGFSTGNSGGPVSAPIAANGDGTATLELPIEDSPAAEPISGTFTVSDAGGVMSASAPFAVVEATQPAEDEEELPPTGGELDAWLLGGGLLLALGGAAAVIFARRTAIAKS